MTAQHSILAPSAAERWVNCPGSVRLCQQYPDRDDSPEAMEGTAAHWVASEALCGRSVVVGTLAPNGIAVTEEMVEGAELYRSIFPPEVLTAGSSLRVETRVDCPSIHQDCWGTPDARYIRDKTLHVTDYKFGHRYVEEFENLQLAAYAYGILDEMPHLKRNTTRIELTIVQPRCYSGQGSVRTWRCRVEDLWPHVERMAKAALVAVLGEAELVSGSHCADCSAIHACPAAQKSASAAIHVAHTLTPSNMAPDELGLVLRRVQYAQEMLKAMETGLKEEAETLIRSGSRVPGYELAPGRGKLEWSRPMEEIVALGQMFGVDLAKPGCVTPTQARDLLKKKGIDGTVISGYTATTSGSLQLKPSDTNLTRRIFANHHKETQNEPIQP